ncbi:hypothetical protein BX070DRAFT_178002, partial [Coemansia spiralis]
ITNISVVALISILEIMTKRILGGVNILQSSRSHQTIVFMTSTSTATNVLLFVLSCAFVLVD